MSIRMAMMTVAFQLSVYGSFPLLTGDLLSTNTRVMHSNKTAQIYTSMYASVPMLYA